MLMAEVISSDAGGKRRLPLWMLNSKTNNQTTNHEGDDVKSTKSDRVDEVPSVNKQVKRRKKLIENGEGEGAGEASNLQKCQSVERAKRKRWKKDGADKSENHESSFDGDVTEVHGMPDQDNKQKPLKRVRESGTASLESSGVADDEIELTMEDLLTIANEYVNADKERQHKAKSASDRSARMKRPTLPTLSEVSKEDTALATGLSKCSIKGSFDVCDSTRPQEMDKKETITNSTNTTTTGDAPQDMLNLFFGPLLSKVPDRELSTADIERMSMTIDSGATKKIDTCTRMQNVEEQPLAKKKSSLKDKIAAFLG